MSDYTDKVVLVTAAGAGIGRECALEFGRRGAAVVVGELNEELAIQTAADIAESGGSAIATQMDATNVPDIQRALALAESTYGGLDVLVNVCGGTRYFGTIEQATEEEWSITIDTNLNTVYRCSKYAIPLLRKRGGGVIINTSSVAGVLPGSSNAAYAAAKGAINTLTQAMALDCAVDKIRVNAIMPGMMLSPRILGWIENNPGFENMGEQFCVMGRAGNPEEAAKLVGFLASDDASYITGALVPIDGGYSAGKQADLMDKGHT
ncbi:MAG: SDR family oxidoreductase [Immundisolibacteraceae bacterium]|nr:SDR family oxidoreductase [Immundisolibacteraceae bacterium]